MKSPFTHLSGSLGAIPGDTVAAGIEVVDYITANGCDNHPTLKDLLINFQTSFNNDVASNIYPGPNLTIDGSYGNNTASALNVVVGPNSATPANSPIPVYPACKRGMTTFPTNGGGGTVVVPGGATVPVVFNPNTPAPTTTSKMNWTPWIIGAAAVAAGAGAYYLYRNRGMRRNPMFAKPMYILGKNLMSDECIEYNGGHYYHVYDTNIGKYVWKDSITYPTPRVLKINPELVYKVVGTANLSEQELRNHYGY